MTAMTAQSDTSQPSAKERFAHALTLVPEIKDVETRIRSTFRSDVVLMTEIPDYLLTLGGKRIRPILALLCSKALGATEITPDIIDISAGIELIHMATLTSSINRLFADTNHPRTLSMALQRPCSQETIF
jgi:hypothetical protein